MRLWSRIKVWWTCFRQGHNYAMVKRLNILAHVRCERCGGEWCHNRWEGGVIPWNSAFEDFFASTNRAVYNTESTKEVRR
jgi:hypothetical protein